MKQILSIIIAMTITSCGGGYLVFPPWYDGKVEQLENHDGECEVVFVGDSRVAGGDWEGYKSGWCNFGIGGDLSFGVLDRLDAIISKTPAKVVIQVGYNDLNAGYSVESVINNLQGISVELEDNDIDVYFSSTLLSTVEWINPKIESLNNLASEYCQNNKTIFIDLNEVLAPDGYLTNTTDGVHLDDYGYDLLYLAVDSAL